MEMTHPNPHVSEIIAYRARYRALHAEFYGFLLTLSEGISTNTYDPRTLVDIGFLLREISESADDTRKETNVRKEACEKLIALDMTSRHVAGEEVEDPLHGLLASGSPNVRLEVPRPAVGSPENAAFIHHLGVDISEEAAARIGAVCRADWKRLTTLVTEVTTRGQRMPPGLTGKQYSRFSTIFRRKNRGGVPPPSEDTD